MPLVGRITLARILTATKYLTDLVQPGLFYKHLCNLLILSFRIFKTHVMCHMSRVTCHMSRVRCHVSGIMSQHFFFLDKEVEGLLSLGPTTASLQEPKLFKSLTERKVVLKKVSRSRSCTANRVSPPVFRSFPPGITISLFP